MLAISFDYWEFVHLGFWNGLAFRLDDLQVAIVDPDAPDEKSFLGFLRIGGDLWRHVEDIKIQFVDAFFAGVLEIVLIDLAAFQGKGVHPAKVFQIFLGHAGERRHRKIVDFFEPIPFVIESEV